MAPSCLDGVISISMNYNLICRRYDKSFQNALRLFDCSASDPPADYETEITDWIQDRHEGCVTDDLIDRNVEDVYIYELSGSRKRSRSKLIAYGALTTEEWPVLFGPFRV